MKIETLQQLEEDQRALEQILAFTKLAVETGKLDQPSSDLEEGLRGCQLLAGEREGFH